MRYLIHYQSRYTPPITNAAPLMPHVRFTAALQRFYPKLQATELTGQTVAELLHALETQYPGLTDYLVDERGRLRQHINIYIGEQLIRDRNTLLDPVGEHDEILIFQALSGG